MGALVRLKNKTASPFVGTLFHKAYCARGGPCGCRQEQFLAASHNPKTGEIGHKRAARSVPVGFSIAPKGLSEPLHRAVLQVPGVKEALARQVLQAVPVEDTPAISASPLGAPAAPGRRRREPKAPVRPSEG